MPSFKFKCTGCGNCCTGAPGYVWLTKEDISKLAYHLKISEEEFLQTYTRRVGNRYSLLEDRHTYDCVFLKEKSCAVYEARPKQCVTFPWWPENIASKEGWESLKSYCEGIDHPEGDVVCIGEMEFGTAGMRGIMGDGPDQINVDTIRKASQGVANYLKGKGSVVIGYDNRHNSKEFARETARVFAGNGITVYLSPDLRPTPYVSYCCRRKKASAAVMITASHNPPEYNGYKVYWSDGAQVVPPHDSGIIEMVNTVSEVKVAEEDDPLILYLAEEEAYVTTISKLQRFPDQNRHHGKDLRIIYSNLHGTGITLIHESLKSWGFTNVSCVEEQMVPDGDFPTVKKPNPEEASALRLGMKQLEEEKGDIFIAHDPDADRIGLVVMHEGKPIMLNGNQIAAICIDHILSSDFPKNGAIVSTIVSSRLLKALAEEKGASYFEVLTGFKYIGELIGKWEDGSHTFLFGAEESHGYLLGTHARDKDALVTSCLLAEIALKAKLKERTLIDNLNDIYKRHGHYTEKQVSLEIAPTAIESIRTHPPTLLGNTKVLNVIDYEKETSLPKANVLSFDLEDGARIIIRPSGTEPKIKIYGMAKEPHEKALMAHLETAKRLLEMSS